MDRIFDVKDIMKSFAQKLLMLSIAICFVGCGSVVVQEPINVPSDKGVAIKSVQVLPFQSRNRQDGNDMRQKILGELNKEGHVKVKSSGAEAVLGGQLGFSRLETDSWSTSFEQKGKVYRSYHYKMQKTLTVNYELNVGGEMIGDTHREDFSEEWSSSESTREAQSQAWTEKSIDSNLMNRLARQIAADISPHKVMMNFTFLTGDDENIKVGLKYIEKKRYDQAISILRQVINQTPNIEDRAVATYDVGLIYEMQGDFEKAFEYYRDANQMDLSKEQYIDALTRAERRFEQDKKFRQQTLR